MVNAGDDHIVLARRSESAISESFEAETLVLDPHTDRYVRLNASGSLLWQSLEHPTRSDELEAVLIERWHLPRERAREDVLAFLGSLSERGLVELTQP
jgi:hypothetical protein